MVEGVTQPGPQTWRKTIPEKMAAVVADNQPVANICNGRVTVGNSHYKRHLEFVFHEGWRPKEGDWVLWRSRT